MRIFCPTFVFFIVALLGMPAAECKNKDYEIDKKKIYYGNPDSFKTPAVIKLNDVFAKIPEYQDAKKKSEDDPEYYILLEKANEKFQKAVKKAAQDGGYDLVGEAGTIKSKTKDKDVPDITDKVIEAIPD
jgi:Skp family chaperone for outer membrane proteins